VFTVCFVSETAEVELEKGMSVSPCLAPTVVAAPRAAALPHARVVLSAALGHGLRPGAVTRPLSSSI